MMDVDETIGANAKPADYYDRYSRQYYVIGEHAMNKMGKANVFISGMSGVGVEIAKNVALAGVMRLTIHDTQPASLWDLTTQYYLSEKDAGVNRGQISAPKIAELNPYVLVDFNSTELSGNLSVLDGYTVVVLADQPLSLQLRVNAYCRERGIYFIAANHFGVVVSAFSDCGKDFDVFDTNGETAKEVFLQKITKGTETTVLCAENQMHGLDVGEWVKFTEVKGMTQLNYVEGKNDFIHRVKKVNTPYELVIDTDSSGWDDHTIGGVMTEVKRPIKMSSLPLAEALEKPNMLLIDLGKPENPGQLHIALQALHRFRDQSGALPKPWDPVDAEAVLTIAKQINATSAAKVEPLNEKLVKQLAFTARGGFIGLTAFLGGVVAQEVIKSISGKFTPLNQFLYLDIFEITAQTDAPAFNAAQLQPVGSRYDGQLVLFGQQVNEQLLNVNTFMIGAGAIGCEMMKNMALLGIGAGPQGKITLTDNDLIEKSNLNRQFLFRDGDLQKPKSATAARAATQMNPNLKVEAHLDKVSVESEDKYSNAFFQKLDFVVNALDNVQARLYTDSRCVTNQKALFESGTMGTKGHVQIILPHLTETYASQRDPPEESFPLCTIKSFPAAIQHTIQWARSKFESLFVAKPAEVVKFFEDKDGYLKRIRTSSGPKLNRLRNLVKMIENRPKQFSDCLVYARLKFQSYFNHLIRQLIHAFPLDMLMKDGTPFWKLPKRPPVPVEFDPKNENHMNFVLNTALLIANVYQVKVEDRQRSFDFIRTVVAGMNIPEFVPKNKKIETDPNVKEEENPQQNTDELEQLETQLRQVAARADKFDVLVQEFEKDDDSNHHIDFITACSNLRAQSYTISAADRLETKRIAGRIIPAIATTTAAVAGLVSIEMVKYVQKQPLEGYRNCFLNLALPYFAQSEPAPCSRTYITKEIFVTLWDQWELRGDVTLQQFIDFFLHKYRLKVNGVFQEVTVIYMALMPTHKARVPKKLFSLLKNISPEQQYIDLIVAFANEQGQDVNGPTVRFWFRG